MKWPTEPPQQLKLTHCENVCSINISEDECEHTVCNLYHPCMYFKDYRHYKHIPDKMLSLKDVKINPSR
jgi:hypothetical protein